MGGEVGGQEAVEVGGHLRVQVCGQESAPASLHRAYKLGVSRQGQCRLLLALLAMSVLQICYSHTDAMLPRELVHILLNTAQLAMNGTTSAAALSSKKSLGKIDLLSAPKM